jgi:hypothetical protein
VSDGGKRPSVTTVYSAVVTLALTALVARAVWWLLAPLMGALYGLIGLGAVVAVLRGWFRR